VENFPKWSRYNYLQHRRLARKTALMSLALLVNGTEHKVDAAADQSLLSVLRDNLNLTGTKYGCGEGQCGACTVLLNGRPVRSCRTPVSSAIGKSVITIEGLEQNGRLHPVQEAFLKVEAFECGYCTSGMIMSAVALLKQNPAPTENAVREFMNGNVCRCCTYPRILEAVKLASARTGEQSR
jgi:aerobic-type carbon monoxide dehydrogenase small subunit (CoxS/CutS family)